jgi:hypothetical protein
MAYTRGDSKQIIVGAAALFVSVDAEFDPTNANPTLPDFAGNIKYNETLSDATTVVRNVGYTSNGLELQFQPNFGEVNVDQLLDVAKLYKQGMKVDLKTSFAEATLENLLVSIAARSTDLVEDTVIDSPLTNVPEDTGTKADASVFNIKSGEIGECPVERGLIAVGPGTGDCAPGNYIERIYVAYRALSIDNVTMTSKRDAPSMFDVSFRLLPANNGSYGKIVDRTVAAAS